MLYNITIFSRGGIILWSKENQHLAGNPISALVRDIFLQEKQTQTSYNFKDQQYTLQWEQDNVRQIFVVSVVPRGFPAPYVQPLLERVRGRFTSMFPECEEFGDFSDFDPVFEKIYTKTVKESTQRSSAPRSFAETEKGQRLAGSSKPKSQKEKKEAEETKEDTDDASDSTTDGVSVNSPAEILRGKGVRRGARKMRVGPGPSKKGNAKPAEQEKPKRTKQARVWTDDLRGPANTKEDSSLSYSNAQDVDIQSAQRVEVVPEINLDYESESSSEDYEEDNKPAQSGFFGKLLPSLTGKTLTAEDLAPVMDALNTHLTEKNVASEIARSLCDNVGKSLEGTKLSTFGSAKKIVNDAMAESLTRILTPKKEIDVIRDIRATNEKGKPYTIVFVGVNGVGKSTSLSKVCSWLQQNGMRVLIAACDTFRSGAVEQLKVHAGRLNAPLFEQGYGKDASHIAAAAVRHAEKDGTNVVLVDTAGRMQDNEPLMKALSNLVHHNNPNLVLFVGEALVGNDGVHQLQNFNRSLELLSNKSSIKMQKETIIDGVMLTKFDTIDDKVGAAVSMVYSTGIPVMFVGVGQHYQDLKKLNVGVVVKALMK